MKVKINSKSCGKNYKFYYNNKKVNSFDVPYSKFKLIAKQSHILLTNKRFAYVYFTYLKSFFSNKSDAVFSNVDPKLKVREIEVFNAKGDVVITFDSDGKVTHVDNADYVNHYQGNNIDLVLQKRISFYNKFAVVLFIFILLMSFIITGFILYYLIITLE